MRVALPLLVILITLFGTSFCGTVVDRDDVVIKDLRLFLEGEEWWIKAVSYQPYPLGGLDMNPDLTGGTGLCSPRQISFGDLGQPVPPPQMRSACFDLDFFDGSLPENTVPPGPEEGWFVPLWKRDFPVMVELGINTIRLYHSSPITYKYSVDNTGENNIAFPLGKNHIPFMDYAAELGLKVIFPLLGEENYLRNTPKELFEQYLMNQIDEIGNHSALLMYTMGNELGLASGSEEGGWDETMIQILNPYIAFARQYQKSKWGRSIPITVAEVDYPASYVPTVKHLDVDVFTTNAGYRGPGFSDLWSGIGGEFPGWLNLSCTYDIPVFIGEWGWESADNVQNYFQPDWFNEKYADLVANQIHGCIGGAFFEFNDEPSKVSVDQQTMGLVNFTENGECSRQVNCWEPDLLVRKDNIFLAAKEGTWNGKPYNFNADIFKELVERPPVKLADSVRPEICKPYPLQDREPITSTNTPTDFTFVTSTDRTFSRPGSTQSGGDETQTKQDTERPRESEPSDDGSTASLSIASLFVVIACMLIAL